MERRHQVIPPDSMPESSLNALFFQLSFQPDSLRKKRQMRQIFWTSHPSFAANNALQRQHSHRRAKTTHLNGFFPLGFKTSQSIDPIEKIDHGVIPERHHGWSQNRRAQTAAKIQDAEILSFGKIHPDVGIQSRCGDSLQNGRRHAGYLNPHAFLPERVNKLSERRKFS